MASFSKLNIGEPEGVLNISKKIASRDVLVNKLQKSTNIITNYYENDSKFRINNSHPLVTLISLLQDLIIKNKESSEPKNVTKYQLRTVSSRVGINLSFNTGSVFKTGFFKSEYYILGYFKETDIVPEKCCDVIYHGDTNIDFRLAHEVESDYPAVVKINIYGLYKLVDKYTGNENEYSNMSSIDISRIVIANTIKSYLNVSIINLLLNRGEQDYDSLLFPIDVKKHSKYFNDHRPDILNYLDLLEENLIRKGKMRHSMILNNLPLMDPVDTIDIDDSLIVLNNKHIYYYGMLEIHYNIFNFCLKNKIKLSNGKELRNVMERLYRLLASNNKYKNIQNMNIKTKKEILKNVK